MEVERQRRWWIAGAVAVLAVATVVVVSLRGAEEQIATAAPTTTSAVVLPPDTDVVGERTGLATPGEMRVYVARLQSSSGALPGAAQVAAADRLLGRRLELLVDCSTCVTPQPDGSLRLEVGAGPESPSLDLVEPLLPSLDEVIAAPVRSSSGQAPCSAPSLTDLVGSCVEIGEPSTLHVADAELGGPRPDGQRSVSARLDETGTATRAMLVAACRVRATTCPTGRLLLVRGERVLADLSAGGSDGEPSIALGRHGAAEAHLLAAELVGEPALDGWTISLDRSA